jgi:transcriptional regulator with XRE-family HTH domain
MRKNTQQLLGRRFADLRKRAKLTQGDVAQRLNVATATVSRLERGTQWTDFPTLLGLCELYGVEWAELMAIPGGRDSAQAAAVQQLVDSLRGCSAADVELVRDLAEAAMRNRTKLGRRKGTSP